MLSHCVVRPLERAIKIDPLARLIFLALQHRVLPGKMACTTAPSTAKKSFFARRISRGFALTVLFVIFGPLPYEQQHQPAALKSTMIIAAYPSTELRLKAIWSQIECVAMGVDRIILSAPDWEWSHSAMGNFTSRIKLHLPYHIYSKITVQFYANDRYDAGLWCDALQDEMGEGSSSSVFDKGQTNYLLINDSIMAIRPYSGLLDRITSLNGSKILFVSLSYWKTDRVEEPIWLESAARAFSPQGIRIFYDKICRNLRETVGGECARLSAKNRKRCIVEHTEIAVAKYYNSTEILGLYPGMVPANMTTRGGSQSWTGSYQFWKKVLVNELDFPFVKVSHGFLALVPENEQPGLNACIEARND